MAEYLIESYKIYEATTLGEWKQLSDEGKQRYALVIACGKADLSEGSLARETLWGLFKGNSETRANLEALLNPVPPPYP